MKPGNFFNSNEGILQKNKVQSNDLFVEPIDLNDNNIPNGNSIYLLISNKLNNIALILNGGKNRYII